MISQLITKKQHGAELQSVGWVQPICAAAAVCWEGAITDTR